MAMEQAQHLMSMSREKIAESLNQRGGKKLHRLLLVYTVLHKARTIIKMENYKERLKVSKSAREERAPTAATLATPTIAVLANKDNTPPVSRHQHQPRQLSMTTSTTSSAENSKPNCARCLKRRVTEMGKVDAMVDICVKAAKHMKYESDSELSHDSNTHTVYALSSNEEEEKENDSENQSPPQPPPPPPPPPSPEYSMSSSKQKEHEPMQTDQLTNLVHSFNSRLSGLLGQIEQQQNNGQQQQQAFSVCCTQVKDSGIGSLSQPCMALIV